MTCAMIVNAAVTKANSTDPAKIRDALADLENVQGATAVISYKGGNGTPTRPVAVIRIHNGKRSRWSAGNCPIPPSFRRRGWIRRAEPDAAPRRLG